MVFCSAEIARILCRPVIQSGTVRTKSDLDFQELAPQPVGYANGFSENFREFQLAQG